jgi:hypothetical protein
MTVEQTDVIDRICTSPEETILLAIFDHLPWQPFDPHHSALVAKLNNYVEFVASGQALSAYPNARAKPLELHVFCKFRPSEEAVAFFARVAPQVEGYDINFAYGPAFGRGYEDDPG